MITVIVNFELQDGMTRKEIISKFEKSTQKWRDNRDLISKNYLIDLDSGIAGEYFCGTKKCMQRFGLVLNSRK